MGYERELRIGADAYALDDVRTFTRVVGRECGLGDNQRFRLMAAVHEAACNALKAGRDPVHIRAVREGPKLSFYVQDGARGLTTLGARIIALLADEADLIGSTTARIGARI
jgi:anti-sigma regulatory factor (Ser/Thr protein kinase)